MIFAVIVITLLMTFFNGYLYLYILQKEHYSGNGMLTRSGTLIMVDFASFIASLILLMIAWTVYFSSNWKSFFYVLSYIPPLAVVIYKSARYYEPKIKYTNRMKRLIGLFLGIVIIITLVGFIWRSITSAMALVINLALPLTLIANLIISPFEKKNNQKYINKAKLILSREGLIKIGITGSYGKTSVKEILREILSRKYVLTVTEGNYNTPLGIAKTVEKFKDNTEVFIAEMGARHKGDICELVEIVKPDIGILTGITEQHIETFGSLTNILEEKRILIDSADTKIINSENDIIRNYCQGNETISVGFDNNETFCDYIISDIYADGNGSRFKLENNGQTMQLKTNLLGRHNIINIALAVAVADKLNVEKKDIKSAVESLEPLPHRQEKTVTAKGITIIDDSYNINPVGVVAALDTLNMFNGRKIVAVSGFVELGEKEKKYNKMLGEWISEIADIIVIIGEKFKKDIIDGALKNENRCNIITVKNIEDCKEVYKDILSYGDILLILADLPPYYLI